MSSPAATTGGASRAAKDAQAASAGTGFGLENLRTRAAAFGGSVDLEPAPDGGTLLRLTLPAAGGAANA